MKYYTLKILRIQYLKPGTVNVICIYVMFNTIVLSTYKQPGPPTGFWRPGALTRNKALDQTWGIIV